jgi:hypothetical protein
MTEVLKPSPAEDYHTEHTIGVVKDDEDIDADTTTGTQDALSLLSQGAGVLQDYEALLMDRRRLLERLQALLMERRSLLEHQKNVLMFTTRKIPYPEMLQKLSSQHKRLSLSHETAMVMYRWITDKANREQGQ